MNTINEFEYYVIDVKCDKAYPSIIKAIDSKHTNLYIGDKSSPYRENPIPNPKKMEFYFGDPIPRKPVIGDYFDEPESVVSKKIADVLLPMSIRGIQLVPAKVTSNKGEVYDNLHYIHIFHYIKAMDEKKSDFRMNEYGIYFIDSFKLDEKILKEIPLEERLVFKLKEKGVMNLYHRSVVDAIMATNPEGVQFTKVEDWTL